MDTDSDAWNYWNSLRTAPTTEMPTIYTLEGSRINANGIVLPGDNAPKRLDYVFGEQIPLHQGEYEKISRGTYNSVLCISYIIMTLNM